MDDEYQFGYIGVIDILGFGDFSLKDNNYYVIDKLMKRLNYFKRNNERNFNETKIVIMSDTVFVLTEIDSEQKYDPAYFGEVLRLLSSFKGIINNDLKLFSRASITIGKYRYNEQDGILFGPGITRSAKIAEKSKYFISEGLDPLLFFDNPAVLIIDKVFFVNEDKTIMETLKNNGTMIFVENDNKFTHCGGGFYYYNTFYDCFNDFLLTSINDVNYSKEIIFNDFCKKVQDRFDLNKEYSKKYIVEKMCFEVFKKDWRKHTIW